VQYAKDENKVRMTLFKSSFTAVRDATCPATSRSYFHNSFPTRLRLHQDRISRGAELFFRPPDLPAAKHASRSGGLGESSAQKFKGE